MSRPSNRNPLLVARNYAELLRMDSIAAGQIKEYVPVAELLELLGITDDELSMECVRRIPKLSEVAKTKD